MHKDGKWARQLIELQEDDGKWGWFHSLSQSYNSPVTTEQALRRLEILGYTIEDPCIEKAISYMNDCLTGRKQIPDRREKLHDWDIFTSLILSTWIRRFTHENPKANLVASQWAAVISSAFTDGTYHHTQYVSAFQNIFGQKPRGGRLIDFVSFYQLSLTSGCLDPQTEQSVVKYILNKEDGIYYIYDDKLSVLPQNFACKKASRYLAAAELLSGYRSGTNQLAFIRNWIEENRNENGMWDMGKSVKDQLHFPLSDDWRKAAIREADCTERICKLLDRLHGVLE